MELTFKIAELEAIGLAFSTKISANAVVQNVKTAIILNIREKVKVLTMKQTQKINCMLTATATATATNEKCC